MAVAALNRLLVQDRRRVVDDVMVEIAERDRWVRETIGYPC